MDETHTEFLRGKNKADRCSFHTVPPLTTAIAGVDPVLFVGCTAFCT